MSGTTGAATGTSPTPAAPRWVEAWAVDEGADRVRTLFVERFGVEPDGVWSAPGRVNLIGEHTDYNGGLCLPIALPHRAYAALRRRTPGDAAAGQVGQSGSAGRPDIAGAAGPGARDVRLVSAQDPTGVIRQVALDAVGPGTVDGWPAYVAGVAWALGQAGHPVDGFDVAVDSCVPFGAGLSSSASLEAAVAVGLDAVFELGLAGSAAAPDDAGRTVLAAACIRAENEIAGAPTGGMDQSAALRSRAGHALLLDCRDGSVRQVPFDLAADGLALLVIDTRAEHALVDGQYAARRATCEAAAVRLGVPSLREIAPAGLADALATLADGTPEGDLQVTRVRHVVTEIERVERFVALLDAGRVREVGPLMDASHTSLRDDYEVSCRELDVAVEAARSAGALGARMTGGGFGGSAIALVPAGSVEGVAAAVAAEFAAQGLAEPEFLVAVAGPPAG
ncbi:galactokinase [Actinomycetota bacterium]|nr:galactokinase [Actinomycetota bacterium]